MGQAEPDPAQTVHVSRDAAERIRGRGGRLFLRNEPVGRLGLRDRFAYSPPSGGDFECHRYAKREVQICVPSDFPYQEVIVRAQRRPFRGIRVYVNGRRWGWRGDGEVSGGYG